LGASAKPGAIQKKIIKEIFMEKDFGDAFEEKNLEFMGQSYPLVFEKGDTYLSSQGARESRAKEAENFYRTCMPLVQSLDTNTTTCIDVGANAGVTTIALSYIAVGLLPGKTIQNIIAIEPGLVSFKCLTKNVQELPNVKVINCALGSRSGQLEFVNSLNNSSASHVVSNGNVSTGGCLVSRLDQIVDSLALENVGLVKIDVEGYEKNVLLGAVHTIEKFNPWIYMEFNSWTQLAYGGTNPREFLDFLLDWFDVIRPVNKSTGALESPLSKESALGFLHSNLVYNGCVDDLVLRLRE
jgi:FkbM family methyltransferase